MATGDSIHVDRPFFTVKAIPEGKGAQPLDLTDRILSFEYVDEEKKADKLTLVVDNEDLSQLDEPNWRKGVILEVAWGYPGRVAPTRRAIIQRVKGGRKLRIEAHGMAMVMHKVKRTKVWEGKTLAQIAKEIAATYGADFGVDGGAKEGNIKIEAALDKRVPHRVQAAETDASFLSRLAKRHGLEFYVDSQGLHFKRRNLQQPPVATYTWFNGEGNFLDFEIDNDITGRAGSVTKKGFDPLGKKVLTHRADNDSTKRDGLAPVIEIVDARTGATHLAKRAAEEHVEHSSETTPHGLQSHAEGKFRQTQQVTVKLSFKIIGDPDVLAKRLVIFQGLGRRVSGRYYTNAVTHTIDNSGYITSGKSHTDGHHDNAGAGSKAALNKKGESDKPQEIEKVDARTGKSHIEFLKRGEERHE